MSRVSWKPDDHDDEVGKHRKQQNNGAGSESPSALRRPVRIYGAPRRTGATIVFALHSSRGQQATATRVRVAGRRSAFFVAAHARVKGHGLRV